MADAVGIVGLGLLGHAVAARLAAAGTRLVGYDGIGERREALKRLGGEPAGSIAAVAGATDVVITILPSLDAVEAVILGRDGIVDVARAGTTVVQTSTIS